MRVNVLGFLLLAAVWGCSDPVEELQSLEAQVRQLETIEEDTALVARAVETFQTFAEENPEDTLAPRYALMAADLERNRPGRALYAIAQYDTVYRLYSNRPEGALALFSMALTFDEVVGNRALAGRAYTLFLDTYPQHPLAKQAEDLRFLAASDSAVWQSLPEWEKRAQLKSNRKR
jgi:tetratricopeptide (TPR) repeat protein